MSSDASDEFVTLSWAEPRYPRVSRGDLALWVLLVVAFCGPFFVAGMSLWLLVPVVLLGLMGFSMFRPYRLNGRFRINSSSPATEFVLTIVPSRMSLTDARGRRWTITLEEARQRPLTLYWLTLTPTDRAAWGDEMAWFRTERGVLGGVSDLIVGGWDVRLPGGRPLRHRDRQEFLVDWVSAWWPSDATRRQYLYAPGGLVTPREFPWSPPMTRAEGFHAKWPERYPAPTDRGWS